MLLMLLESLSTSLASRVSVSEPVALLGVSPPLESGLIGGLSSSSFSFPARDDIPIAAIRIYELAFLTGFGVSTLVYVTLNYFWPPHGVDLKRKFEEVDETSWEEGGRPDDSPATYSEDGNSAVRVRHSRAGKADDFGSDDDEDRKAMA